MTKKTLNQNGKYVQELIDIIEPNFIFSNDAINRFQSTKGNIDKIIHFILDGIILFHKFTTRAL